MSDYKGCLATLGVLFASVFVIIAGLYVYYEWIWEEWPTERIERVTGVRVPEYRIVECERGKRFFNGDYTDWYIIEFETMPSDGLFDEIDGIIATDSSSWSKEGDCYHLSTMWGNGLPVPEGENDEDDGTFSITITRGERMGRMTSGMW